MAARRARCRLVPGSVMAAKLAPSPTSAKKCANSEYRLDRAPGLRGHQEQRAPRVDRVLHGADRAGVGRVEHPQARTVRLRAGTCGAGPRAPARSRPSRARRRRRSRRRPRRRRTARAARAGAPCARRSSASRGGWPPRASPPAPRWWRRRGAGARGSPARRAARRAPATAERSGPGMLAVDGLRRLGHGSIVVTCATTPRLASGRRLQGAVAVTPRGCGTSCADELPRLASAARSQPRARARARHRGGRPRRGPAGRHGRQGGGRPGRGRRHAPHAALGPHGRRGGDRRGREGRGADALQRRADRRRVTAAGGHRGRPARGHHARRPRDAERAGGDRPLEPRHDVRPGPVRVHGKDGRAPPTSRTCSTSTARSGRPWR